MEYAKGEISKSLCSETNNSALAALFSQPQVKAPVREPEPVPEPKAKVKKAVVVEEEKPKKKKKKKKAQTEATEEKSETPAVEKPKEETEEQSSPSTTVFVGNVSLESTPADLQKFFSSKCQTKVQTVRFRSLPVTGCAVDQAGNQKLVRKVCAIQKKYVEERDNCNAYVVFQDKAGVKEALALNGIEYMGKRLRVDQEKATIDTKHSVFVGGLNYEITEEQIRAHFAAKLTEGADAITNIRVIRDPATGLGKGFGYVSFKDMEAVAAALTLHETKLAKKKIRVSVCGKRFKNKNTDSQPNKRKFEGRRADKGVRRRLATKKPRK